MYSAATNCLARSRQSKLTFSIRRMHVVHRNCTHYYKQLANWNFSSHFKIGSIYSVVYMGNQIYDLIQYKQYQSSILYTWGVWLYRNPEREAIKVAVAWYVCFDVNFKLIVKKSSKLKKIIAVAKHWRCLQNIWTLYKSYITNTSRPQHSCTHHLPTTTPYT